MLASLKWKDTVVVKFGKYRGTEFIVSTIDAADNIWLRKANQKAFSKPVGPFTEEELEKVLTDTL